MFIALWTLCSSLCTLVAAIIAIRYSNSGLNLTEINGVAIAFHWILSGLGQWQLLKPYITNAYNWGLITIVGGIVSSFLTGLGCFIALDVLPITIDFYSLIQIRSSNAYDFWLALIIIIVSFFISGFTLGWMQKLVIQHSVNSVYITYLPILNGFIWLLYPALFNVGILLYSERIDNIFSYGILMFFLMIISGSITGLIKGFTIARGLNI